jgi:PST family polysaccharide transporter
MSASPAQPASSASSVRASSLTEGVLILLALTVVQRLVGFLRGILFCRWLDAEQLGQWDMAFNFLVLASPLAVLGLPGSFGRYAETYRDQGVLRTFLRRTTLASLLPAVLFCLALIVAAPWTADLLFGTQEETSLVYVIAATLTAFIVFNYLTSLFMALRSTRIVSYLQFINTILFAAIGLGLMYAGRVDAESAVAAFGGACFISCALAFFWVVRLWRELPRDEPTLSHGTLWSKLLPFAFWVWVVNWIANSFEMADRYMIIHYGNLAPHEALALVGQYHTARVIPTLIVGLADMFGALLTPHLAKSWEAGERENVAARLRFVLKLFVLLFLAASIVLVIASPLFFHTALEDKFGFGQEIFPWTMACALWTGLAWISHNWLYCAEKSRLVCVGLSLGLATNVALNYLLLPTYGLSGVVVAAAAAKLTMLAVDLILCRALGMAVDRGLLVAAALPAALIAGPWFALVALLVAASGLIKPLAVFDSAERLQLGDAANQIARRLSSLVRRTPAAAR